MASLKRFWSAVSVTPDGGGFAVLLDRRGLRTPLRAKLIVPSSALAEGIADEWRAAGEIVEPAAMTLTRLANTALDRVAPDPAEARAQVLAYAGSDMVCFLAERPPSLVEAQSRVWGPVRAHCASRHGAALATTTGLGALAQSEATQAALTRAVAALDPFALTALHGLTASTGSLALGLAALDGALDADQVFAAAFLDELHQAGEWGVDREAEDRRLAIGAEIAAAMRFHALASP